MQLCTVVLCDKMFIYVIGKMPEVDEKCANILKFAAEKNLLRVVVFAHLQQSKLKGTVSRDSCCMDHHCSGGYWQSDIVVIVHSRCHCPPPVSLTPAENKPPVVTPFRRFRLIAVPPAVNLPPVSMTPVGNLLSMTLSLVVHLELRIISANVRKYSKLR
jgi:hypothetical protein